MQKKGGSRPMLVLKKDALVKLLGDELYGIELENEMLQDLENRANERREILDIVGNLCDAYGYNRREVQAKAQTRLKKLLACKDGKDDWDPYAYIKLTELSKTVLVPVRR
ncbi:hypothetical protein [Collinsella aerofaciens]|uniref:hypothetical protein n=1 Tax=Collinsella aerofaciens TaxID=74426 RepID=UPI00232FA5F8|nr:hypothetical protein [Collinsella aerofaciens]MDB1909112.1 hypothetical protein [Collinsella aerofaciens]MDB1910996.1 hypothetical protein [Collinsella aerofaciens]MDB1912900.1 hypothetical protein [Collinsella aerofaciens]